MIGPMKVDHDISLHIMNNWDPQDHLDMKRGGLLKKGFNTKMI